MKDVIFGALLVFLFGGSGFVWWKWLWRFPAQPLLNDLCPNDAGPASSTRSNWRSGPELMVVSVATFLLASELVLRFLRTPDAESRAIDLSAIVLQLVIFFGLTLLLSFMLVAGTGSWSSFGITNTNLLHQIRLGFKGYLAAVLPMAFSMAVTYSFRGPETQHSLLKLLVESPNATTILLVGLTAVVCAPLWEELQFRVIFQGVLTTMFPPYIAISIVAILFSLVHGWQNGLALLPLALILGHVFHRYHSYLAVVVIHALFNATMLAMALLVPQVPQ